MEEQKLIVVIDSDACFCFFVKNTLETEGGFKVISADDSQSGIELVKNTKPDLILVDRLMPKIFEQEITEILENDPQTRNIPFILLTSMVSTREIGNKSIVSFENYHFIPKDVEINDFAKVIQDYLAHNKVIVK